MKHIGEIVNKDGLSTSKRLWIFGLVLAGAIIGFACFVNTLPFVDGMKCDELYAAMDLNSNQGDASNQKPEDVTRAYLSSAQAGNVDDMLLLADCYLLGLGVEMSPESAVEWYSKAIRADAQNPRALMGLALCYYMGRGIQKDRDKAVNLGYDAIVFAEDKKGNGYLSVRNNPFGLLLAAFLPRQDAERPPGIWLHENLKERSPRAELPLLPLESFFCICFVVFVICCFVTPNILDAPWQLKVEKIIHSAFVASTLTIAFVCGGRANPFILITGSMVCLAYFSFSWKYILPFGVLCVWGLNLLFAYSLGSVLGISPAWNRIPQVVYNYYGNILISDDLYMSVALPDVCSAVNGTWLYMMCLVCAVLMVALRQSAAARNALASKKRKSITSSGEDAASPLACSSSRLAVLTVVVALGAWAVGCSEREERQVSAKEEFEIPLTLVQRMMAAHDKAYSNALEVVTQPRGEMKFADDVC